MKTSIRLIFMLCVFAACKADFDAQIDKVPTQLSITSTFGANMDTTWFIHVNSSKRLTDTANFYNLIIKNASIRVYENDALIAEPTYVDTEVFLGHPPNIGPFVDGFYTINDFEPMEDRLYRIEVEVPGIPAVEAETVIPKRLNLKDVSLSTAILSGIENVTNGNAIEGSMSFIDSENEENYYRLYVEVKAVQNSGDLNIIEKARLIVDNAELNLDGTSGAVSEVYFRDVAFNGQPYQIDMLMSHSDLITFISNQGNSHFKGMEVHFILQNLTPEIYNYYVTRQIQQKTINDPFAQPVQIPTNVKNGLGIFAGFNQSKIVVDVAALFED